MKPASASIRPAAILSFLIVTAAHAGPPGHGFHPPMPDQRFFFQCRLPGKDSALVVEEELRLPSPAASAKLDQVVSLPAPLQSIRLMQYLPKARLDQTVAPDESGRGKPALFLTIDGPKQSHQRWLVAGDHERDRLTSFIATWRYMAVDNKDQRQQLLEQFKTELTRPARLTVSCADGSVVKELPAESDKTFPIKDLECSVRILSFFPHYAMDIENKKPINVSQNRVNPAALVEIEHKGQKEQRWVFAKFPDFKASPSDPLPIQIRLDCPLHREQDRPDFVLVTVGRSSHELWTRHKGKETFTTLKIKESVGVAGSKYTFQAAQFTPACRLEEEYRPAEGKRATTALQIEYTDAAGQKTPLWLQLGGHRVISTAGGRLSVTFGPRQTRPPGGHE